MQNGFFMDLAKHLRQEVHREIAGFPIDPAEESVCEPGRASEQLPAVLFLQNCDVNDFAGSKITELLTGRAREGE